MFNIFCTIFLHYIQKRGVIFRKWELFFRLISDGTILIPNIADILCLFNLDFSEIICFDVNMEEMIYFNFGKAKLIKNIILTA